MSIKTRVFKEENYKAIHFNGKTLRIALDPNKPITELQYPEFYDVKITNKCEGKCNYCYMDSKEDDIHYSTDKLFEYLESLDVNQRPFQIAYGGGETTSHPYFGHILSRTRELDISPNYTTNGMWSFDDKLTECIITSTKLHCDGVAVSCHPHLKKYWTKAVEIYLENNIFTNLHIMISDKKSIDYFLSIYKEYKGKVDYFVLLPLINQGRCANTTSDFDYLFHSIKKLDDISDIAFGAKFYERLKNEDLDVSLYEPESMSKFIDLKDGAVYGSSFDVKNPIKFI